VLGDSLDGVVHRNVRLRCEQYSLLRVSIEVLQDQFRNKRGFARAGRAFGHKDIARCECRLNERSFIIILRVRDSRGAEG
jgi:hypothetical protein